MFCHPDWMNVLAQCYGFRPLIAVIADGSQGIKCAVPIMLVKHWLTAPRLVSLPFTDYCPVLCNEDLEQSELVTALEQLVRDRHCSAAELRWGIEQMEGVYPGQKFLRHVSTLTDNPKAVMKTFRKGVKSSITQGEKAGLKVRMTTDWAGIKAFYSLHLMTRKRLGSPVQPLRFFRLLWEYLISQGMGFTLCAYKGETLVASAVFLHWNKGIMYKYSASDSTYWHLRPNNLILWRALQWGCENGYRWFDWGRTDPQNEGLRTFKRGWGGEESQVQYSIIANAPPARADNELLKKMLSEVIQKSPLWVCRVIGELLYKYAA